MIRSAVIRPCGPPKPRKAVFETVLVFIGLETSRTAGYQ